MVSLLRVPVALAIAAIVVGALVWHGDHPSVADRVKSASGSTVSCDKAGLMLVVGKREKVYECQHDDGTPAGCYAVASGDLVDVTAEADAADVGFVCS